MMPRNHLHRPPARAVLWTFLALALVATRWAPLHGSVRRFTPEGAPYRVDFDYTPILRYHLASSGSVRGVLSNEWTNVRAAFDQWQAIPCTRIRFSEGTPSPALTAIPIEDGRIDVHWVSPGLFSVPALGGSVSLQAGQIASAWFVDDGTGVVLQSVILINRDLDYLTDYEADSATRPFLESVVLHEIGHVLGLNHAVLGGATMWWFQGGGVGTAAGLSEDERTFAAAEYGTVATRAGRGSVRGTVRRNGAAVLGAVVIVESADARVLAATVTRANGQFDIPGLPPGPVRITARPLDPDSPSDAFLIRGREIDVSAASEYLSGATDFSPPAPVDRSVTAGGTAAADFQVASATPAWRIVEMRTGRAESGRSSSDAGLVLPADGSTGWVGVYVQGPVPGDALLAVKGPGLVIGETRVLPAALRQLTLVQATVSVEPGSAASLRTLEVTAGGVTQRAPGFVEIGPTAPDDNHDGVDDRFQRRYFAPFTSPDAGPERDPDGDGFVNRRESLMGSNPLDPESVAYRIVDLRLAPSEIRLRVETAPGRRYQVRTVDLTGGPGAPIGEPFTATQEVSEVARPRPVDPAVLLRVQGLP